MLLNCVFKVPYPQWARMETTVKALSFSEETCAQQRNNIGCDEDECILATYPKSSDVAGCYKDVHLQWFVPFVHLP